MRDLLPPSSIRLARLWTASLIRAVLAEVAPVAPPIVAAATEKDAALRRAVIAEMECIMEAMER